MGRIREKACDRCQTTTSVLYRVQSDESGTWQFVCDRCLPALKNDNPHYTYGGTWKARKRH
ncbi:hypothetical protein PN498_08600 [Oscillatoria sp. CS-180]|uniref:hypothetical protein n=1 Tax=Oscillatoria sp. CS-180 TaxID=3021720 RepID=UPI00232CD15C|nr:hypothetical protein [Oscillatoria sp. CS-180]MDB9526043.1 hypothetical protein [Oscillatoria sp. CS-180]